MYEVRLGHRVLLDALLDYIGLSQVPPLLHAHCNIPAPQVTRILTVSALPVSMQDVAKGAMEMLATTAAISPKNVRERTKHWPSVRIALNGLRVPPDAISRCKQFVLQVRAGPLWKLETRCALRVNSLLRLRESLVQIPGEAEASIMRLRRKLESPGANGRRVSPTAVAAIDALAATVTHMQEWDLKPSQVAAHTLLHAGCCVPDMHHIFCAFQIVLDPLLWPHADYLTGSLIQMHVLAADESGASSLVAAGTVLGPNKVHGEIHFVTSMLVGSKTGMCASPGRREV